jgi:hypothetical protein
VVRSVVVVYCGRFKLVYKMLLRFNVSEFNDGRVNWLYDLNCC